MARPRSRKKGRRSTAPGRKASPRRLRIRAASSRAPYSPPSGSAASTRAVRPSVRRTKPAAGPAPVIRMSTG